MSELDESLNRLRRAIDRAVVASDPARTGPTSSAVPGEAARSGAISSAEIDQVGGGVEAAHSWTDLLRRWLGR